MIIHDNLIALKLVLNCIFYLKMGHTQKNVNTIFSPSPIIKGV